MSSRWFLALLEKVALLLPWTFCLIPGQPRAATAAAAVEAAQLHNASRTEGTAGIVISLQGAAAVCVPAPCILPAVRLVGAACAAAGAGAGPPLRTSVVIRVAS
jgi:hypothetical protein